MVSVAGVHERGLAGRSRTRAYTDPSPQWMRTQGANPAGDFLARFHSSRLWPGQVCDATRTTRPLANPHVGEGLPRGLAQTQWPCLNDPKAPELYSNLQPPARGPSPQPVLRPSLGTPSHTCSLHVGRGITVTAPLWVHGVILARVLGPQALAGSWGAPGPVAIPGMTPPPTPRSLLSSSSLCGWCLGTQGASPQSSPYLRESPGPRCSATTWCNPGQPPPLGLGKGPCFHCVSPWVPGARMERPRVAPASCPITPSPWALA